jgi:hypothetical protein
MTRVVALVDDLIDQSRITAAAPDTVTTRSAGDVAGADVVVVDLGGHGDSITEVRDLAPGAFVVAFGRHDDADALKAARVAGADRVLARSKFFADVVGSLEPTDR